MSNEAPDFRSTSTRLLQGIPVIILVVLANVFISFCTAGVVLVQLMASGHNRYLSLIIALIVAVLTHAFIILNHKARAFVKQTMMFKNNLDKPKL